MLLCRLTPLTNQTLNSLTTSSSNTINRSNKIASTSSVIKKLLILFLSVAGLYYARPFLIPLCIGGVLATLFLPICKGIEKKKVPKGLAVLICILILLAATSIIASLLGWQISELTGDITLIKQKVAAGVNRSQQYIFDHIGVTAEKQSQILQKEQPSVTGIMQVVAGSLISLVTTFILVLAYIFLLLYYRIHIREFFIRLTPTSQRIEMQKIVSGASHVSQQYLLGLSKMIVCLWIMYAIGFSAIGVKNAIFFAVLCGLLEIIPFIGNITGTSLTVLVSALHGASFPMLAGIVVIYVTIQFIQGWLLEPVILGPQVKINPLFTIIALVLGELIWGIPGIFLAIPLIAMFKIVCDHIEPLKPYGFLIGEIETSEKEKGFIKKIKSWFKKTSAKK